MMNLMTMLLAAFLTMTPLIAEEQTHTPTSTHTPDFTPPPKDATGPVFPPEDLIGEPPPETNRFLAEFVSMLATLGLIIALILFIGWFLKRMVNTRMEQANSTNGIKVLERRTISPKTVVYLLDVQGQGVIIAESHSGVTRLADFPIAQDEVSNQPSPTKTPTSFSKLLEQERN